jgi:hypothetical protein
MPFCPCPWWQSAGGTAVAAGQVGRARRLLGLALPSDEQRALDEGQDALAGEGERVRPRTIRAQPVHHRVGDGHADCDGAALADPLNPPRTGAPWPRPGDAW